MISNPGVRGVVHAGKGRRVAPQAEHLARVGSHDPAARIADWVSSASGGHAAHQVRPPPLPHPRGARTLARSTVVHDSLL